MALILSALGPVFKVLMEIITNVITSLMSSPATVAVNEPKSGIVVDVDPAALIGQHDWLLDRPEAGNNLQ